MTEQKQRSKGEGDRESARRYNEETQQFVDSGRVDEKAVEAREAVEGAEEPDLAAAEQSGKARAKEFDPGVARDFSRPTTGQAGSDEPAARKRLRAQLDELEQKLDRVVEQSKKFSEERRSKVTQRIDALRHRIKDARSSINGLQSSTSGAWEDISSGLSEAWRSVEQAFKRAGGRFR